MSHRVLIVDDSLTVRMDLADIFGAAGLEPFLCESLGDARARLQRDRFDLVILDVLLPDGDGIDLLRELRADPERDVPVMLLSAEIEVRDRIRGLSTGADVYVGKPYDRAYIVSRAHELLRKHHPEGKPRTTVLVIDDSETFRAALRQAIEDDGYAVVTATSGEEGLRMAADLRPAAVVVDGSLPGIDGPTVIRRLRLDTGLRRIPCLLLTASTEPDAEIRAFEAGADAFVRKDEELSIVLARLGVLLRRAHLVDSEPDESVLGPKKILAVDDSVTYLHELASVLRADGYDVVPAHSGEEALELLDVEGIDCVVLDLLMPGLGGEGTCRLIKADALLRNVPVIILTSVEDHDAMLRVLGCGADDYIVKSADQQVVRARVRAQLRRRQIQEEFHRVREQSLRMRLEKAKAEAARELAETRAALVAELERKNRELEAFSYSVSHDLRAPLRAIAGFSQFLLEDYGDALDAKGQGYLDRVRTSAARMGELIEDLLEFSRLARAELKRQPIDLAAIASDVANELNRQAGDRTVQFVVQQPLPVDADPRLTRVLLENLLGNAWKFTAKVTSPVVEVGALESPGGAAYFVRDNGAGFDMAYVGRLFAPFQRLHSEAEFSGTGIGLANVQRIADRHGGRVWAEAEPGKGATFYFTLRPAADTAA